MSKQIQQQQQQQNTNSIRRSSAESIKFTQGASL